MTVHNCTLSGGRCADICARQWHSRHCSCKPRSVSHARMQVAAVATLQRVKARRIAPKPTHSRGGRTEAPRVSPNTRPTVASERCAMRKSWKRLVAGYCLTNGMPWRQPKGSIAFTTQVSNVEGYLLSPRRFANAPHFPTLVWSQKQIHHDQQTASLLP